jgi:hypothetical protein
MERGDAQRAKKILRALPGLYNLTKRRVPMKRNLKRIGLAGAALAVLTAVGFGVAAIIRRKR